MYRVPSSARQDRIARLQTVAVACILIVPAIFLNVQAIYRWNHTMTFSELMYHKVIRYEIKNLLVLTIPIIGIICSFSVIYGIMKRWNIAIIVILMLIIIITTGTYLWYKFSDIY
jgi:hypothetical protein